LLLPSHHPHPPTNRPTPLKSLFFTINRFPYNTTRGCKSHPCFTGCLSYFSFFYYFYSLLLNPFFHPPSTHTLLSRSILNIIFCIILLNFVQTTSVSLRNFLNNTRKDKDYITINGIDNFRIYARNKGIYFREDLP
jgi:hypothetical protein